MRSRMVKKEPSITINLKIEALFQIIIAALSQFLAIQSLNRTNQSPLTLKVEKVGQRLATTLTKREGTIRVTPNRWKHSKVVQVALTAGVVRKIQEKVGLLQTEKNHKKNPQSTFKLIIRMITTFQTKNYLLLEELKDNLIQTYWVLKRNSLK